MKSLPDSDIPALCAAAGFELEQLSEGTVRINPKTGDRYHNLADVHDEAGLFILIGRERYPTLHNAKVRAAGRRFPILASCRCALIESEEELSAVADALAKAGWCVDNDAYVFPQDGRWIAYVSHHDT